MQDSCRKGEGIIRALEQLADNAPHCIPMIFRNENGYCWISQHFFKEGDGKIIRMRYFEYFCVILCVKTLHIPSKRGKYEGISTGCLANVHNMRIP